MPTVLQLRRGTTAQNDAFTGAVGELSLDTQKDTLRVHDGSAAGGSELVALATTQTLTNKTLTSPTITGTGAIAGTFTGNITGDVTGNADTATALATARTIAGKSFDGSANITIAATDLSDTDQALATSSNVQFGNLTLSGNLTVNGTTSTVASTNTTIADNLIELNSGAASNANDTGILIERGSTGDNAIIAWDESADKFTVGTTTATASDTGNLTISTGTLVANIEGNVTGNVTGDVTGNADTATTLETARTIGGTSFDGSANIAVGLSATATALASARTIAGQSFDGSANITIASTDLSNTSAIALLTSTQTLTNKTLTSPTITGTGAIAGTFTGNITGDVTGNADTATALGTTRAFSLTGDVTASGVNFDGTGAVELTTVIGANTVGVTEINVTDGTVGQFLKTDGSGNLAFATVATPTLASLSLDTTDDVQFDSFGVGTAASGVSGEIRATDDVTAFYSSDESLKENIKNIENPLEKISQINGVTFDWTEDYIKQHGGEDEYFVRKNDVGVIAQEVEKVLPQVVATRKDGIKAVKYDRIVALLIEAVKELKKEIDELKK